MRVWLRRLGPWVLTAVIVVALLRKYHLHEIIEQLRLGHWLRMLPFALSLPIAYLILVVACDLVVLRATVPKPLGYWEIFAGKAASSMLLVVGYYASSGGYGVWLARKTGVTATRAAGIVLYVMTCDLVAVCLVASTAMAIGHIEAPRWLFRLLLGIGAVQILLMLWRPFASRTPELFAAWRDVPRGLALLQILGRCGNILLAVAASWAGARAFGMPIPFHAMATYGPVILLVGSLPISVAGFGVSQSIWLVLAPWASAPQILAFQFVWNLMVGAATVLRGLPFLRRAILEIDTGVPEVKSRVVGGLG
jgi:hypothetical protein